MNLSHGFSGSITAHLEKLKARALEEMTLIKEERERDRERQKKWDLEMDEMLFGKEYLKNKTKPKEREGDYGNTR